MSEQGRGDLYRLAALLSELTRILDALPQEGVGDFQVEMVPPPPLPPTGIPGLGVGQPSGRAPARTAAEWANLVPSRPPSRIPPPLPPWIEPPAATGTPAEAPPAQPPTAPADGPRGEPEPSPVRLSPQQPQAGVERLPPSARVPEDEQTQRMPPQARVDLAPSTRLPPPAAPDAAPPITGPRPKREIRDPPLPPSAAPETTVPASRVTAAVDGSGRAALPIPPGAPRQPPPLVPIVRGLPQGLVASQRREPPAAKTPAGSPVPLPARPEPEQLASPALLRPQRGLPSSDWSDRTPSVSRAPDDGLTDRLPTDAAPISIVVPSLELPSDIAQLDPPVEEFDLEAATTVPPLVRAPLDARPVMWRGRSVGVVAADVRHALRARLERRFVSRLALRLP